MIGKYNGALRRVERVRGGCKPENVLAILAQVGLASSKYADEYHDAWASYSHSRRAAVKEKMMNLLREKAAGEEVGDETVVDRIVNEGEKKRASCARLRMIEEINPWTTGLVKEAMRRIVVVEESGLMLVHALRHAAEAPDQNRIEVDDLDWFIPAAIGIAEEVEIQSWGGEEADYDRLTAILTDEARKEAIRRLFKGQYEYGDCQPWLHQDTDPATRAHKLALVLSGELEQALEPFSPKVVSWEVVRNIANSLTNGLYPGEGVDINQAHMSSFDDGPMREFTLEEGRGGDWRDADWDGQGWYALDEDDVCELYWKSWKSVSGLEAVKERKGKWNIRFIPSQDDPTYRGRYYELYEYPEQVKNFDPTAEKSH